MTMLILFLVFVVVPLILLALSMAENERKDATIARQAAEIKALNTTLSKRPSPVIVLRRQGKFIRMAGRN